MAQARDASASAHLEAILAELKSLCSGPKLREAESFARLLLGRLPDEELDGQTAADWAGLCVHLLRLFRDRPRGQSLVRVYNPSHDEHGYECAHTVIEILNDDMPFLVDTVAMVVAQHGGLVHLTLHPVVPVARDPGGHVLSFGGNEAGRESVIHLQIERQAEPEVLQALQDGVNGALRDVKSCVADFVPMRDRLMGIAAELSQRELPHDRAYVEECVAFLRWIADNHFTFLGYREYHTENDTETPTLRAVQGSGLGILRTDESKLPARALSSLAARELEPDALPDLVILSRTNARSSVHRPGYMDYIGIIAFDADGKPVGEQRFLGLYTSNAYTFHILDLPLVRRKTEAVLARSGLSRSGHGGKALLHILETLPRDELFQATAEELHATAVGIFHLQERQRTRLFIRRDRYGRFLSCLVFVPRDRMTQDNRQRIEALLKRSFQGERADSQILVGESMLARLHVVIRPKSPEQPKVEVRELEAKIAQIVRNWQDELRDILVQRHGEAKGLKLANRFGKALPGGYIEEVTPQIAAQDVEAAASLRDHDDIRLSLYRPRRKTDTLRFKLFKFGGTIALSDALPMLENMGFRALSEHPYAMSLGSLTIWIQDFDIEPLDGLTLDMESAREPVQQAFEQIWRGRAENDPLNRLIIAARLDWRQVTVLRGYLRCLLQTDFTYSQAYMERTLCAHPLVSRLLVDLFEARFDPDREDNAANESQRKRFQRDLEALLTGDPEGPALAERWSALRSEDRDSQIRELNGVLREELERVASLDEDRILRAFRQIIMATLRTNYFQLEDGRSKDYVAYKLDCALVPNLPKPLPYREIFVYSPRVEGVHLRGGPVARGGLRWSDRREDFRTEVLGLMKAQMVKNTVIVPVGAKGGFVVKQPPASQDREAFMAEGVACYRIFINGLLDVTDNLDGGRIVPPSRVVRHDPDDSYLVVAADKGTATFSDIANAISGEHGFWMGDAFASGGSKGYDHKKMGITARGAWESVKRHFRALGKDCQNEAFTCVGVGDMSGDVFGNGMLLSRHIKLLAAFDHRHIFLDPTPDVAASYAERERMFALPRSSWDDYDRKLISAGGGIFPRSAKVITLSPQIRAVLDIEAEQLSPVELIRAILGAPVELLWNGGIGTYVKAESETNADVGDRANNANRLNGNQLRCKIVGEGGNLGLTQRGRIEAAQSGVLLNTDAIDNSAGVDTSDHEVNIKILLNLAIAGGALAPGERDDLLVAMTDEVADLVIFDNYRQNLAISLMRALSIDRIGAKQHFVRWLEQQGLLDRQLEFLPSEEEFNERRARGLGLTRPELAVLLAYSKIHAYNSLLDSAVPEDPYLSKELALYFPTPLRERFANEMQAHPLRREIIATQVTNSMVNRMGATFVLRMQEDTGQTVAEVAKAYTIAREVLRARELWAEIDRLGDSVDFHRQIDLLLRIWNLMRNMTRWLLNAPGAASDIAQSVERYTGGFEQLLQVLPRAVSKADAVQFQNENRALQSLGYSEAFAQIISQLPALVAAFDIIEVAFELDCQVERAAKAYFSIGEQLHLKWLAEQIEKLPVEGRWHAHARGVLRDELYAQHRALTAQALRRCSKPKQDPLQAWAEGRESALSYTQTMFGEMHALVSMDYPTVSVGVRRLSQLVAIGAA
ncbi:MAG: NAD-glutamate dehydrogenase [Xanthomonadales bacterium]|nr:NAD-glutamate dehydrogenase [Xanthomonadales bacterium]